MQDDYKLVYNTVKEYRDMFKIITYKRPLLIALNIDRSNKRESKVRSDENIQRSVRRTRAVIADYVANNDFELFVTFTFDPRKVNRYNLDACYTRMQLWLANQRRRANHSSAPRKEFSYVIVPEAHKDGAIHFHALISGLPTGLRKTNVIQNNKRVYNLLGYRYGFTNAQHLDDDKEKTAAYLCKYITKDMQLISNRRRYWCSKNLEKPQHYTNGAHTLGLTGFMSPKTAEFENDQMQVHHVPKKVYELFTA